MQAKISKTLEAIIARTAFETSKRAITHSLKDFLTLEILREEGSLAHQILTSRLKDWEIHQICLRIESEIRSVSAPDSSRQNPEEFFPLYTRELQRLFAPMHHVSTAHALLHIVSDPHTITSQVLAMYHFDAQAIATELQKMTLEADQTTPPDTNFRPTPELRFIGLREPVRDTPPAEPALLDKFGTDLTYEARRGRIDPVVGREREMERIVQILSRRKKNNPILIGEAGVGKSAIVEGLALRMAAANGSIRSTYRRSWPGPNTEVSSKNGCSDFSKNCAGSRTRSSSSTKYTPSRAQVRPREASTRPTFSNPPWRGANCRSSEPRRWTNIAKISRAIPRWNAAFRKSSSNPLRKRKPCKSCTTSHPITNGTTECATRTKHCGPASP
jgi:hypothetical protein